ncbi:MAG: hypothetical protein C0421_01745 [Hyphomonas sp.]|uniref:TerB family tellurite resistance protein n=1 Tax=Hyphomonas sp. TaxID=87 RepID=UPI0025C15FD4|nr:TerB family tellurite resistance protein [Hyphomonas sp.]MBA4337550.1 hypothetical protein [Hyphomonas sp.]
MGGETLSFLDLLGRKKRGKSRDWTQAQAFWCILQSTAMCDGHLSPEESSQTNTILHSSRLFSEMTAEDLSDLHDEVISRINSSKDALEDACGALSPSLRLTAFVHAFDLLLSDMEFDKTEDAFLQKLSGLLNVSQENAAAVAAVMRWKHPPIEDVDAKD